MVARQQPKESTVDRDSEIDRFFRRDCAYINIAVLFSVRSVYAYVCVSWQK